MMFENERCCNRDHLIPFLFGDPLRVIGKQCRPKSDVASSDQGLHCLQVVQSFSLKMFKSHSPTYFNLIDSYNIQCGEFIQSKMG